MEVVAATYLTAWNRNLQVGTNQEAVEVVAVVHDTELACKHNGDICPSVEVPRRTDYMQHWTLEVEVAEAPDHWNILTAASVAHSVVIEDHERTKVPIDAPGTEVDVLVVEVLLALQVHSVLV